MKRKYGNIYEISLPSGNYVYICWIRDISFGIFDYFEKYPSTIESLKQKGFRTFKTCRETAIRKGIWKCIGELDLEKENITFPDLAIYMSHNTDLFTQQSRIMRDGNPIKVPQDYYISLVKKGYITGFFDRYENFERWLDEYFEHYPHTHPYHQWKCPSFIKEE